MLNVPWLGLDTCLWVWKPFRVVSLNPFADSGVDLSVLFVFKNLLMPDTKSSSWCTVCGRDSFISRVCSGVSALPFPLPYIVPSPISRIQQRVPKLMYQFRIWQVQNITVLSKICASVSCLITYHNPFQNLCINLVCGKYKIPQCVPKFIC